MNINAMGRPVSTKDVAEKLGMPRGTVKNSLNPNYSDSYSKTTVAKVRKTATEMGYALKSFEESVGRVTQKSIASEFGVPIVTVNRALHGKIHTELAEKIKRFAVENNYENPQDPEVKARHAEEKRAETYYCKTAFHDRGELQAYMRYLRKEGYGNTEIAKKAGITRNTVRRNIGPTPPELAKHNRVMGQKLRGLKNAARRQYLHNKPIAEYNARVEQVNKLREDAAKALAAADALKAQLTVQTPAIEALAAKKLQTPSLNLASLTPTALQ